MSEATLVGARMEHDGLVARIARKYRWAIAQVGVDERDLIQFGRMGVMRAMQDYDPARGCFSTYAGWWIHHHIRRGVWNDARTIRVPVNSLSEARRRGKVIKLPGRVATDHWEPKNGGPPGDVSLLDMLGVVSQATAESEMSDAEQRELLLQALETLTERERDIIVRRFGIGNARGEEETLESVGASHGITRERCRQVQNLALESLGKEMRRQALKHSLSRRAAVAAE
jgi:RNA polymerase sigma factor (sigma-70 family)